MGFKLTSKIEPTKTSYFVIENTMLKGDGEVSFQNKIEKKYFKSFIVENYWDSLKPSSVGQSINEIIDLENTTNFDENKVYELELKSVFEKNFLNTLSNPSIDEDELLSQAYELKLHLMINNYVTSAWLVDLYCRSASKETVIVNLISLLTNLDEMLLSPTLVMMVAYSLSRKSVKVKNNALELLESLIIQDRLDAYNLLNEMENIKPSWLEDYRQSILNKNCFLLG